jgi:hypothetical protein
VYPRKGRKVQSRISMAVMDFSGERKPGASDEQDVSLIFTDSQL